MKTTRLLRIVVPLLAVHFLSGCLPRYIWKSQPEKQTAQNEFFEAQISPYCTGFGCEAFILSVTNKTDRTLEVNWNKTLYVAMNQTSGGFMFEGVVYKDRNNPKSPDIIFPNGTLTKSIWPNNLVHFSSGQYGGWRHESMPPGENGVYLTVGVDGKEVSEKLTVNLTVTEAKN